MNLQMNEFHKTKMGTRHSTEINIDFSPLTPLLNSDLYEEFNEIEGGWQYFARETPQTFDSFARGARATGDDKIYFILFFPEEPNQLDIEVIVHYLAAFYQMEVILLPELNFSTFKSRITRLSEIGAVRAALKNTIFHHFYNKRIL